MAILSLSHCSQRCFFSSSSSSCVFSISGDILVYGGAHEIHNVIVGVLVSLHVVALLLLLIFF